VAKTGSEESRPPAAVSVHTFVAHFLHKILDVGSWKTIQCVEAQRGILGDARAANLGRPIDERSRQDEGFRNASILVQQPFCISNWRPLVYSLELQGLAVTRRVEHADR